MADRNQSIHRARQEWNQNLLSQISIGALPLWRRSQARSCHPDDVGKFFPHTPLGSIPAELKNNSSNDSSFRGYDCVYNQPRPAGVEPATFGFEARHSVQLSYGRKKVV